MTKGEGFQTLNHDLHPKQTYAQRPHVPLFRRVGGGDIPV